MRWHYMFSLILVLPLAAFANGFSGVRSIKTIHIEGSSFVAVIPTSSFDNPDNCGSASRAMVRTEDGWYKDTLAVLLTASSTDKPVNFYFTGCGLTPWGYTVPIVFSVDLNP